MAEYDNSLHEIHSADGTVVRYVVESAKICDGDITWASVADNLRWQIEMTKKIKANADVVFAPKHMQAPGWTVDAGMGRDVTGDRMVTHVHGYRLPWAWNLSSWCRGWVVAVTDPWCARGTAVGALVALVAPHFL